MIAADYGDDLNPNQVIADIRGETMLRGILLCPDANTTRTTASELRLLNVEIVRAVDAFPDARETGRLLNAYTPDLVFLHCQQHERALACAKAVEECDSGVPIIGLECPTDPHVLLNFMRAGVREFLPFPLRGTDAAVAWQNVEKLLTQQRPKYSSGASMQCFLPSKPGVGTSVIAVQTAAALAETGDQRVLLLDLDSTTASASFLLRVPVDSSVQSLAEYAYRLDEDLWAKLKFRHGKLDVIGAGVPGSGPQPEPSAIVEIVRFAVRMYDFVIVDMSGVLDSCGAAVLEYARHVYLVCTQEVPALHLGRIKSQALAEMGIQDRTSVVLNRLHGSGPLSLRDVEAVLQARVRFTFPNDYKRVNAAAVDGTLIPGNSDLGRQFRAFAASLATGNAGDSPGVTRKKRFFHLFGSSPEALPNVAR